MPNLPYEFAPLRTERLLLRLMTVADVDAIHAYQSREDVCRYLPFEPRSRDEVAAKVAQYAGATTLAADGDYWQLAVERGGGVIGWTLHPDHQGQGYMSEAARAVLRIAFEEIGLHRVMAELDPRNNASIALCKRLGMREEAYFVEDLWFKGEWGDTGIYAILEREWAQR
ncbi:MAG TPA: GNAT family protein [Solirubrobacter sp.]|nr:GNAT family protein [Solirubrobacter sp.]